jgi:hypothetical protein
MDGDGDGRGERRQGVDGVGGRRLSCGEGGSQAVQLVKAKSSLLPQPVLEADSVWEVLPEGEEVIAASSTVQSSASS